MSCTWDLMLRREWRKYRKVMKKKKARALRRFAKKGYEVVNYRFVPRDEPRRSRRAKEEQENGIPLPKELLTCILAKIPFIYIWSLLSVCKLWRDVITSEDLNPSSQLCIISAVQDEAHFFQLWFPRMQQHLIAWRLLPRRMQLLASCRGLLLCGFPGCYGLNLEVINPLIGIKRGLPNLNNEEVQDEVRLVVEEDGSFRVFVINHAPPVFYFYVFDSRPGRRFWETVICPSPAAAAEENKRVDILFRGVLDTITETSFTLMTYDAEARTFGGISCPALPRLALGYKYSQLVPLWYKGQLLIAGGVLPDDQNLTIFHRLFVLRLDDCGRRWQETNRFDCNPAGTYPCDKLYPDDGLDELYPLNCVLEGDALFFVFSPHVVLLDLARDAWLVSPHKADKQNLMVAFTPSVLAQPWR